MKPNPIPFAPPSWQLPHLLSLKPGERGLLVVALSRQPPEGFVYRPRVVFRAWRLENSAGGVWSAGPCPLGIVGGVIAIEGVGEAEPLEFRPVSFEAIIGFDKPRR